MLRVLATAIRATRGRGQVCGFDLTTEADAVREHVGLLGHATALYPDLTARENLLFAQRMHGGSADPRAAEAALERVGLAYHRNERVRDFSAGMARRVALARLLLRSHELLLLDEPYASFDGEGVDLLNEVLLEARGRGSTVIVATHDPARAAGVLDRTAQLEDGRLIEPVPR